MSEDERRRKLNQRGEKRKAACGLELRRGCQEREAEDGGQVDQRTQQHTVKTDTYEKGRERWKQNVV